jgi:hypothetical protein
MEDPRITATRGDRLEPPPSRASLLPALIGFLLAGAGILALGLWLGSREAAPRVPQLTLAEPTAAATVDRPLVLVFDVDRRRMRLGPGGWGVGQLHIHAWIDDREIMPAAADIEFIGSPARYRWTISGALPGERTARVGWSDLQHRPVQEGVSETVRFTVR